jgi:hypothetical protein
LKKGTNRERVRNKGFLSSEEYITTGRRLHMQASHTPTHATFFLIIEERSALLKLGATTLKKFLRSTHSTYISSKVVVTGGQRPKREILV